MDFEPIRQRAFSNVVAELNTCVNEDGIIFFDTLSGYTKSWLRRRFGHLKGDEYTQAKVDFVKEQTGKLLYVKRYNLAERIYQEGVARGYIVDGMLNSKYLLEKHEGESEAEYVKRHAKYRTWSKSVSDYIKVENITREEFLSRFNGKVKVIYKTPAFIKNSDNLCKIIASFADDKGHIDSIKKSKKYSAITKWCKIQYEKKGYYHLTGLQSLQKFINENMHGSCNFENPLYVPNTKLDLKALDLYNRTKTDLIDYVHCGEITKLKSNEKLYNQVRHIRDILGYSSIKECVECMLSDQNVKYVPSGVAKRKAPKLLDEIEQDIQNLITKAYVTGKKPEEVKRVKGMIDITGISIEHCDIFHKMYRANKRSNKENHTYLSFGEYAKMRYNCYYHSPKKKRDVLTDYNISEIYAERH